MAYALSELQQWYRAAMGRRADELRELRPRLAARNGRARDQARKIGMSLRGSGGTFGFPEITNVAGLLETARDSDVLRRTEGLIRLLTAFSAGADVSTSAGPGSRRGRPEWLAESAGLDPMALVDVDDTGEGDLGWEGGAGWALIADAAGIEPMELAARAGAYLGVDVADEPGAFETARRLVPEAVARRERIVPIDESESTIVIATSDPTDLSVEAELQKITGRRVVCRVAPPDALDALMEHVFPSPRKPAEAAPRSEVDLDAEAETASVEDATASAEDTTASVEDAGVDVEEPRSLRVLVVDDEAEQRLFTRAILEKKGYDVVEAEDGVDALEQLEAEGPIGLVVADLNMPRMDGLELIWEVRATPSGSSLPIIVVTGEKDRVLETQLIEEGADDYLRKPIEPRLFLARVESTLRRHT